MHLAPVSSLSVPSFFSALVYIRQAQTQQERSLLPSLFFSSSSRRPKKAVAPSMEIKQRAVLQNNCFWPQLHHAKESKCIKLDFKMVQCRERNGREKYLELKLKICQLKLETCN
jgi:hypothetical protein